MASKPFFKIGEVARLVGVKPHVLRYWESEFPSLKPRKNPSGQRLYDKADIETLMEIRNLLYTDCYTISGARQLLAYQCRSPQGGSGEGIDAIPGEPETGFSSGANRDGAVGCTADNGVSSELTATVALLRKNINEMMALLRKSHHI